MMARIDSTSGATVNVEPAASIASNAIRRKTMSASFEIPGRFVQNMGTDAMDRAMVEGIQRMSRVMGVRTIAEHVEDQATLTLLTEMGIDFVQRFFLGRPALTIGAAATERD
jgi:EAL domain-containing protein (putative c-di-GMP-specific phosphodiesterase class I)